ncbi:hypothetical protein [Halomonas sp. Mc5H-6]|uniref:hypothetical protein n=1 Tax=Halomonas sp. Mc5H-6 TaxID=2954500 RepID=UPI0020974445|nr:hypothetical protein [Halomonas sp. Mc5H-6]MCO7247532.1 hypothetical protein [Halomonas sp. Mc5H-6]
MKQPYENVYLGNFIFALGFQAAQTEKGLSDKSVQLVQQTPDEQKLNDLFINWSGKSFIFEFKRNPDKVSTELEKEAKKLLNESLNSPANEEVLALSNKSHFLGFGLERGLGFIPYSTIHNDIDSYCPLDEFCLALVGGEHDFGLSYDELTKYLAFIASATKSTTDGCGGFILNISDDGCLNMIPFDNVDVLSQSLDIKPEPPSPAPTRSFGPSM